MTLTTFDLPARWLLAVNTLVWLVIQVGLGYLSHRMSYRTLNHFSGLLRTRTWERNGAIYQRVLLVKRWKSLLPAGGTVFPGGFSLKRIASLDHAYLRKWVTESGRAEVTHWMAIPPVVLFFLWNPPLGCAVNIIYAMVVNLPCIIVQRYNRPRLLAIIERANNPVQWPRSITPSER